MFFFVEEHLLRDVTRERDIPLRSREVEKNTKLNGACVLNLIDEEMRQTERLSFRVVQCPPEHLPRSQKQGSVFRVQAGRFAVTVGLGPNARLANAPLMDLIELSRPEASKSGECFGEPLAVGQDLVPRPNHAS
jgi:hypothetical protein